MALSALQIVEMGSKGGRERHWVEWNCSRAIAATDSAIHPPCPQNGEEMRGLIASKGRKEGVSIGCHE